MGMEAIIIFLAFKYKGNGQKIYDALENKELVSYEKLKGMMDVMTEQGIGFNTIIDRDYPDELKSTDNPIFIFNSKLGYKIENNTAIVHKDTYTNEAIVKYFDDIRMNEVEIRTLN